MTHCPIPFRKTLKNIRGWFRTKFLLWHRHRRLERRLEIGCGGQRIEGFETLNMVSGRYVDYVLDASKQLPFRDNSFELIYASHVLEHIPWYQTEAVLSEWVRILKPEGRLEVWVPDGVKICRAFVDAELHDDNYIDKDGWYRYNPERDPCKWASGRIFTYGDGKGSPSSPNWHRAIFSRRFLKLIMGKAGLHDVHEMERSQVRGEDHGWITLGMTGTK